VYAEAFLLFNFLREELTSFVLGLSLFRGVEATGCLDSDDDRLPWLLGVTLVWLGVTAGVEDERSGVVGAGVDKHVFEIRAGVKEGVEGVQKEDSAGDDNIDRDADNEERFSDGGGRDIGDDNEDCDNVDDGGGRDIGDFFTGVEEEFGKCLLIRDGVLGTIS